MKSCRTALRGGACVTMSLVMLVRAVISAGMMWPGLIRLAQVCAIWRGSDADGTNFNDGIRIGFQAGGFNVENNQGEHGMDYTLSFFTEDLVSSKPIYPGDC